MRKLQREFSKLAKNSTSDILFGELGIILNGVKVIEVANRNGFVYVRIRSNLSEFVQAYNESVSNLLYNLPVVLKREGNRYVVTGRDNQRYSQWASQPSNNNNNQTQPNLPRHGANHSFDENSKMGGGDITWINSRQFLPFLATPYGDTSPNVYIVAHSLRDSDGNWKYAGNTGTVNLLNYRPASGTIMALVTIDTDTGNPYLVVSSGTYAPSGLSGTASILPHVPDIPSNQHLPIAFVRLESGTSTIGWDNLSDARQFYGGGRGSISVNATGSYINLNFPNANVLTSGTNAFIEFLGGNGSGGDDSILFSVEGRLATGTNMANLYMFTQPETVGSIYLFADTKGVTGSTTIDVNLTRSGTTTTIFSTQANRPVLVYSDTDGWVYGIPNIQNFGQEDVLSLDIDTVASGAENIVVAKFITGSSSSGRITVKESDGSPSVSNVGEIRLSGGATLVDNSGGAVTITVPIQIHHILVRDEKAAGTNGGTFTAGAWQTRTINTEVIDTGSLCSLPGSNVIRLEAGTYEYQISAPAYYCAAHQARLYDVTGAAVVTNGEGTSEYLNAQSISQSLIKGRFTIAAQNDFRVEHRCETTSATSGLGVANNFGEKEIYTIAEFWKVA